jgi:hypothetical protein
MTASGIEVARIGGYPQVEERRPARAGASRDRSRECLGPSNSRGLLLVLGGGGERVARVPEGGQHVIEGRAASAVGDRSGKHERQIPKISGRFLDLGQTVNSDHRRHGPVVAGHDNVGTVLGIGYETGDATLRRLGDSDLPAVM